MEALDTLLAGSGCWRGVSRLFDPTTGATEQSHSTAAVSPVPGGKFIRIDYTWIYQGRPQEGSLQIGLEDGGAIAHWIDTWHMGDKVMECRGEVGAKGGIDLRGSYSANPGPDWGWRIVIDPGNGKALGIYMYNITPEGLESPAVEARYTREQDCG